MNWKLVRWIDIYIGIPLVYLIFLIKKIFRLSNISSEEYNNLLFIKFWGIGNIIMILPAASALKKKYKNANIDLLTLTNNKDASRSAGIFRDIYTIDTTHIVKFLITSIRTFKILIKKDYDVIVDFEQFARFSAIWCALIGRKKTVGFNTKGQHRFILYTNPTVYRDDIHITKSFYSLVESLGVLAIDEIEPFPLNCHDHCIRTVRSILSKEGVFPEDIIIILHVGTSKNFALRRWPFEHFAELSDRLINNFDVKIIFTGLTEEKVLIERVFAMIKNKKGAINLSGKFNFEEFIALIRLSDLVVSADTAPVHIATSLGVPVVGLYGPNTPFLYGPWGKKSIWFYRQLECAPCITNYNAKINKCGHPEGQGACMRKISPDEVFLGIVTNYFDEKSPFRLEKLKVNA